MSMFTAPDYITPIVANRTKLWDFFRRIFMYCGQSVIEIFFGEVKWRMN